MGFRHKGADSILQKLTNWVSNQTDQLTDFNVGSAIRTLLESIALQIEEFYYDLKQAVIYAIKNAAYHAFGFTREQSSKSSGMVTIFFNKSLTDNMVIQIGTQFHTGDRLSRRIYFTSTQNVMINKGSDRATVPVECMEEGEIGNVGIADICKLGVGNPHVKYIANTSKFTNGKNQETETGRKIRFQEYVHTLQRGTKAAVTYGIKEVSGVSGVYVDDSNIGIMYAYVHDSSGELSKELQEQILRHIVNYRSGGIEVSVRPVVKIMADLDIDVYYKPNIDGNIYDIGVHNLVENYINSLSVAENLNLSDVITAINDTYRDIIDYIDVSNNTDTNTLKNEIIKAGIIQINDYSSEKN